MGIIVEEKYFTVNGKKQKWKKQVIEEEPVKQDTIQIENGISLLDYYTQKALGAIAKLVVDKDGNAYRAETEEEAERIQKELDREGFEMVN